MKSREGDLGYGGKAIFIYYIFRMRWDAAVKKYNQDFTENTAAGSTRKVKNIVIIKSISGKT
ncbi:MAG: hypothetical protein ACTHKA_09715 [Anaerocolumna jejuensis]